ncbi:MAG: polyether ionophore transport system ATP-binding protein, partial [Chloroflexota bacterium]|nr:polyether ionophore transport system ATP-binding protein [Chloroflexota bacterium]
EMTITFDAVVPGEAFKSLDGVVGVEASDEGHTLRLEMQGPADAVIKAAARYPVISLSSHEPSLEDIFMRYYEADPAPKEPEHVVA